MHWDFMSDWVEVFIFIGTELDLKVYLFLCFNTNEMSPVSLVLHTVVIVSIGFKLAFISFYSKLLYLNITIQIRFKSDGRVEDCHLAALVSISAPAKSKL